MQDDNQQSQLTIQSTPPSSLVVNNRRIIQPVSDMSEYVKQDSSQLPVEPTQITESVPNSGTLRPPVDPSKIYPKSPIHTSANIPTNINQKDIPAINNQRVASRVPAVQVYAFLIIIYGAYSLISLSSLFHTSRVITSGGKTIAGIYSLGSPLQLMVLGVQIINITVGIYLLVAKNLKTVNALLTALLIIGGLGLLRSLVSTVQFISYITVSTVVSLLISAGLLMYLWSVKSQVDLASIS